MVFCAYHKLKQIKNYKLIFVRFYIKNTHKDNPYPCDSLKASQVYTNYREKNCVQLNVLTSANQNVAKLLFCRYISIM